MPHIFGNKDEDTAYGLGYAHAEDDFKTIQDILIAARESLLSIMERPRLRMTIWFNY